MPRRIVTALLLAVFYLSLLLPAYADTSGLETSFSAESLDVHFAEDKVSDSDAISGHVKIDSLRTTGFSQRGIESLTVNGLEGSTQHVDEIGSGTFSVDSALIKGLRGLQDGKTQELDRLELRGVDLDFDRLVASLAALNINTDTANHNNRFTLKALAIDLEHLIAQAPEDERTPLRMVSNLLTSGSGVLRMDAEAAGSWSSDGAVTRLKGSTHMSADNALGWTIESDLTVRLPEDENPEDFLADRDVMANLQDVTLLGGDIQLTLTEQGLLERLPASLAAAQGITEAQLMKQARTQADGYGQMYGPKVKKIATVLLAMMQGKAKVLDIRLTLPAESNIETLFSDPLVLPEKLDMQIERRSKTTAEASREASEKNGQETFRKASLDAPDKARAGSTVKVGWQGPHYRKDWIGVFPVDAADIDASINFSYVDEGENPQALDMPPLHPAITSSAIFSTRGGGECWLRRTSRSGDSSTFRRLWLFATQQNHVNPPRRAGGRGQWRPASGMTY